MSLNKFWRNSLFLFAILPHYLFAQNTWVYLKDKPQDTDYFHAYVDEHYIDQLKNRGIEILGSSRWLNAVVIADKQLPLLQNLAFVSFTEPLRKYTTTESRVNDDFSYGQSSNQLEMLNLPAYHQLGYTGKGVSVGIFDGGFYKVDSLPIFSSLWDNDQIKATYDFVNNDWLSFNESTHGMQVLAVTGLAYNDSIIGASPGADFVLARTEDGRSEKHIEELNWVNAMEWADLMGVDIIHSSLGYSEFDAEEGDYTYFDMDGKSTIITQAAELAADRGIFITNSAGNQGNKAWRHITAPCDGKNVLCVGAVDSNEVLAGFSSRGPSSDGRIKPDVVAMGRRTTIPNEFGSVVTGNGTSFSGPIIAGMVACLKEAHANVSNKLLFEAILKGSDRYSNPDNDYGFGLPDVLRVDSILRTLPTSGINPNQPLTLEIYPNPAVDFLKIKGQPNSNLIIYNNSGVAVIKVHLPNWINKVDITTLSQGNYLAELTYQGTKSQLRFVKM